MGHHLFDYFFVPTQPAAQPASPRSPQTAGTTAAELLLQLPHNHVHIFTSIGVNIALSLADEPGMQFN